MDEQLVILREVNIKLQKEIEELKKEIEELKKENAQYRWEKAYGEICAELDFNYKGELKDDVKNEKYFEALVKTYRYSVVEKLLKKYAFDDLVKALKQFFNSDNKENEDD